MTNSGSWFCSGGSSNLVLNMATFDQSKPFRLLAHITDMAVQSSEPEMLHHTFDQDPEGPQAFVRSEI